MLLLLLAWLPDPPYAVVEVPVIMSVLVHGSGDSHRRCPYVPAGHDEFVLNRLMYLGMPCPDHSITIARYLGQVRALRGCTSDVTMAFACFQRICLLLLVLQELHACPYAHGAAEVDHHPDSYMGVARPVQRTKYVLGWSEILKKRAAGSPDALAAFVRDHYRVYRCAEYEREGGFCRNVAVRQPCFFFHRQEERRRYPWRWDANDGTFELAYSDMLCVWCDRGDDCRMSHNECEQLYHPSRYVRRSDCTAPSCPRGVLCAFKHRDVGTPSNGPGELFFTEGTQLSDTVGVVESVSVRVATGSLSVPSASALRRSDSGRVRPADLPARSLADVFRLVLTAFRSSRCTAGEGAHTT